MTPAEYEAVVHGIVAGIRIGAPELSALALGFGGTNRQLGASGYRHQIDVSLIGVPHTYLIECKRWEDKIGVNEILILAARGTDIAQAKTDSTVHCTLATTVGATRGAVTLAKYFNIEIEIVRSAQEFGLRIGKRISVGLVDGLTVSDKCEATVVRDGVVIP